MFCVYQGNIVSNVLSLVVPKHFSPRTALRFTYAYTPKLNRIDALSVIVTKLSIPVIGKKLTERYQSVHNYNNNIK